MPQLEYKATEPIQLTELNTERRTAVIAHAVYDNVDRKKDIGRRGMFTKSWKENKAIAFLIDHDPGQRPGKVIDLFDDEKKAYTKVKFGSHTLGTDTMLMMDEGIIKGASFGFYTIKANKINIKGQPVRELKEVLQDETTVTYALSPINDLAGVVRVTKAEMDNSVFQEFKNCIDRMEGFCRDTKASDECILSLEKEIKSAKLYLSSFDTANTPLITEPDASVKEFSNALHLLSLKF